MAVNDINVPLWHAQFRMHQVIHVTVIALHVAQAVLHPASAHPVVAFTFLASAVRRAQLQKSEPKSQARLRYMHDIGLLAIVCGLTIAILGLKLPLSAPGFYGMLVGYTVINFLFSSTGGSLAMRLQLVAAHSLVAFSVEPPLHLATPWDATLGLLAAMGLGLTMGLLLSGALHSAGAGVHGQRDGRGPHTGFNGGDVPRNGLLRGRAHLFEMVAHLERGDAQLVDVREDHETCHGVLHAAITFPLSRMTDGSMPLPAGLDASKSVTYIYCARGARVHPAVHMLKGMGFCESALVPLSEGYDALVAFGEEVGASPLFASTSRSSLDSSARLATSTADLAENLSPHGELSRWLDEGFPGGRVSDLSMYETLQTLGQGGFGQVKLLRERASGQYVVSKQVPLGGLTPKEMRSLANEVAVQGGLRHPFVVRLTGFYEAGDCLCMLMDYAQTGSLHSYLMKSAARGSSVEVELFVRQWLSQIATGLLYVHSRRVLHRDLSSQNVFLDGNGNALIGDFGLSYRLNGTSLAGGTLPARTQCGTPSYMSPELVNGAGYGEASDVWSFGVLLVEMLTLRLPFSAPSLAGVVSAIVSGSWCPHTRAALEASPASAQMKELVSPEALLHPVPAKRMRLEEVLRRFPL